MLAINLCICTYKRTALLQQCLESVAGITVPKHVDLIVTVIDNDAQQSSQPVVDAVKSKFPYPLHYVCELKRGIPCARNRAIDESHRRDVNAFIFIDDDEWVEKGWLTTLVDYFSATGERSVVSGEVIAELPEDTPAYIRELYLNKKRKTGDILDSCATNNVIVPIYVTRDLGLRFDESRPLAGGTDTIFFCNAVAKGVTIVKCAGALVHETIPKSRTTLAWWSKRKYRAGVTQAWRKLNKNRNRIGIVFSAMLQVILFSITAVGMRLIGQHYLYAKHWLKACRAAGVISGVLGVSVDSYKQVD